MNLAQAFIRVTDFLGAQSEREAVQYQDFFAFYRQIVESVPSDVVQKFGDFPRKVVLRNGKEETWNIQLTAADYLWWRAKINEEGVRFLNGPVTAQTAMLKHMMDKAGKFAMEPDARKALIALMEDKDAP